jgi:hypothetical protein
VRNVGAADVATKNAILNSTVLTSGTVFHAKDVSGCWTYDWTTSVLAAESSNVIVYGPADVSIFCGDGTVKPSVPRQPGEVADLYVVIPNKAVWVEVAGFRGDLNDPARKTPGPVSTDPVYCWLNGRSSVPSAVVENGILPCDLHANLIRTLFYRSGWLYNRLIGPGEWAGTFSISPAVIQKGTQSITEDIRFYGSSKVGPGWLGLSVLFEKGPSVPSNLDSLTGAITYDLHLAKRPWWAFAEASQTSEGVGLRPGELIFSSGPEFAPAEAKNANGVHMGRDLNLAEGIYYKQPVSVAALRFPSFLTLFPIVGVEGGWHLIRYQQGESAQFFRKVVGIDGSIRYPYHVAPNFTSTKAATIDYSFRERFLSGFEPYTDTHPLDAMGNLLTIVPILSRQRRSYSRIALNWPFSSYVGMNVAVQRGSLPPDFASVAWTFTVGLAFASSGTAEH